MQELYLIVSGTNRSGSNTLKVAAQYQEIFRNASVNAELVSLEQIDTSKRNSEFESLERSLIIPARKFIFVSPEYNGSIPGILKSMLDISDYKKSFWGKKALLAGISTGRSGNVRGMEHLTSILNYLKVVVHPNKLPISSIDRLMQGNGKIHDRDTLKAIEVQVQEFISF